MRVPLSWLVEVVPALAGKTAAEVADLFDNLGVEVDEIVTTGPADVSGLVIGEVLEFEVLEGLKKPIRWCQVRVSTKDSDDAVRGIICGAQNFAAGDRVVVALPGSVLPGGFAITARKTYGHVSDGMICSARELGLGDDHTGIMVLPPDTEIGADAVGLLGLHDSVLVTEPTPDRGYQLSVRGLARELAAKLDTDFADQGAVELPAGDEPAFPVVIDDPTGCDRFSYRVLRGFDPASPSPLWMRARLAKAGVRPISLAVDVTNYVMLLLGQPMHAYDLAKLAGRILVRRAADGETLTTLDDVERKLIGGEDLLIVDDERIQGIAGVMGAAHSEITAATTDVLLEAAHFDQRTTSRTIRRHALLSEAGRRFERGVDPEMGPVAIALATELLSTYGGARAEGGVGIVGAPEPPTAIELDPSRVSKLVGVDYSSATVARRLEQVGCTVAGADLLTVTPPTWRPDLVEMADLAEEVARVDGYDRIEPVLPAAPAGGGLTRRQRRRRAVSRALAYGGYVEVPSFPFQSADVLDALRVPADDERRRLVRMANPLSSDQAFLRSSLLPGLLATVVRNLGRGLGDVPAYETGTVFVERTDRRPAPVLAGARKPTDDEIAAQNAALPIQHEHVAIAATGAAEPAGWWGRGRELTWADAIDAVRLVADAADVTIELAAAEQAPWHPGRCAAVRVDGAVVGYAGELHPAVCEALELPKRTVAAELDLTLVLDAGTPEPSAPKVSGYPPATQDVALTVPAATPAAAVAAALRDGAGELLEDVRLFDVYAGEQVGAGRKSLAYTLRFRAPDRTLTVDEATAARQSAVDEAVRRCGAVQRV
ncbi:phenylalanine--tRNA ligase subunit beta [Fodinicola acaciae]|uniref:phenylalanine--tRNA ligase subunit beta n=1 Tax=Fodinicola acaciae TaxID=2681555 RepID=UPI0013D3620A|nr:phenylalanine--tRNA ligase subunit beta [Fodinicola acaciae]